MQLNDENVILASAPLLHTKTVIQCHESKHHHTALQQRDIRLID